MSALYINEIYGLCEGERVISGVGPIWNLGFCAFEVGWLFKQEVML